MALSSNNTLHKQPLSALARCLSDQAAPNQFKKVEASSQTMSKRRRSKDQIPVTQRKETNDQVSNPNWYNLTHLWLQLQPARAQESDQQAQTH